jgi:hypothetical protein
MMKVQTPPRRIERDIPKVKENQTHCKGSCISGLLETQLKLNEIVNYRGVSALSKMPPSLLIALKYPPPSFPPSLL